MNKRDKIDYILSLIKEQTEEFLEAESKSNMDLSPEEIITAGLEIVLNQTPKTLSIKGLPTARVDRDTMIFILDDDHFIPVYDKDGAYDED